MAKFTFNGVDEIAASFQELANLSDRDKLGIIMPAAELLVERQKAKISELFRQRTGNLIDSIKIKIMNGDHGSYAFISPEGKHAGSSTGKRKRRNGRSNGRYSGTNAEVAYILNYGSPRISATHWLEYANEEAEEDVLDAMADAWDDILSEKGL